MFSRAPLSIWPRWCGVYGELSHEQQATVVAVAGRTIAWQISLFYFASGFWKLNSSFLDPSTSCATVSPNTTGLPAVAVGVVEPGGAGEDNGEACVARDAEVDA